MACCCPHSCDAGRLFSRFARRYRKRYQRRGFEPSQKQLLEGIERAGVAGATLLEIGCGVGALHQHLLTQGALSAVGVDLSERMIAEARELARTHGLEARASYRVGDFAAEPESFAPADVVILDKVICCYPNAAALVRESLAKTRRVYAYTIPRDRWFVRLGVRLMAAGMWLIRSRFRTYVHDPAAVDAWVKAQGFVRRYENQTVMWLTRVYARA